jgi:hypothetical protein
MSLRSILYSHYAWRNPRIEIAEAVDTYESDSDQSPFESSLAESQSAVYRE